MEDTIMLLMTHGIFKLNGQIITEYCAFNTLFSGEWLEHWAYITLAILKIKQEELWNS